MTLPSEAVTAVTAEPVEPVEPAVSAACGGTGGSGGTGGTGGTGGIGGIGGTGGTGVSGGTGGITAAGRTYMVLKSVSSDAMSLDISYQIADPFGNYGVGYLLVYDAAAGLGNYNDTQAYTMPPI